MVSWMSALLIFFSVLFFYIHICFHLKKVNDLDVYEIHVSSKEQLEKICDFKQPTSFHIVLDSLPSTITQQTLLQSYGSSHVNMRLSHLSKNNNKEPYITAPIKSAISICNNIANEKYIVEHNAAFLKETNIIKEFKKADYMLRPYMVSQCNYDIIFGSDDAYMPLRYDLNYRNYYYVTEGSVKIKLTPPCSSEYLTENNDYDLFEFSSDYNPWVKNANENIKWMEITLHAGEILFIPAYWWSSILLNKNSTIISLKYQTYISMLSILPKLATHFLQKQNIKHVISDKKKQNSLSFVKSKKNKPSSKSSSKSSSKKHCNQSDKTINKNLSKEN